MTEGWKCGIVASREKRNRKPSALGDAWIGQDQGAEDPRAFGCRGWNHLWAAAEQAVVKAVRCISVRTRPMSWLGSETSGTHPRTKGARCFAGGHRHRIPSTARGLLATRSQSGQQVVGRPLPSAEEAGSVEWRRARFAEEWPSRPAAHCRPARRAHHCRRVRALGYPARGGMLAPPSNAAGVAVGFVGVRAPSVQHASPSARWVCPWKIRPAAFPCSPGSDCRTRTGRSCRFAGASVHRTGGRPVPAAA